MHPEISERLANMSRRGEIPHHLLFHGPRGSGKRTLIKELLLNLYGPGAARVTAERRCVATTSAKQTIEIDAVVSNYHIEIEPSDAGACDRYVVQDVMKGVANNGSIAAVLAGSSVTHKTIVMFGAGKLRKQAQAGLRKTMETHSGSCRLVLVCTNPSRVIDALRSRCVLVRVPLPTARALSDAMPKMDEPLVREIVENSGRSIAKAMHMAKARNSQKMVWEQYIGSICNGIFLEQSPKQLLDVRESLNELSAAGVPSTIVLKTLMHSIIEHHDLREGAELLKREVVKWAAVYEHRMVVGCSNILHLEAFVARFMTIFQKHHVGQFAS